MLNLEYEKLLNLKYESKESKVTKLQASLSEFKKQMKIKETIKPANREVEYKELRKDVKEIYDYTVKNIETVEKLLPKLLLRSDAGYIVKHIENLSGFSRKTVADLFLEMKNICVEIRHLSQEFEEPFKPTLDLTLDWYNRNRSSRRANQGSHETTQASPGAIGIDN